MSSKPVYLAPAKRELSPYMSEDELLQAITEAATYLGWRWTHTRRSDLGLQMGHSGFPDLVLARAGVVLFLELKTMIGVLTVDQEHWLEELSGGDPNRSAFIVRPDRLNSILELLGATVR